MFSKLDRYKSHALARRHSGGQVVVDSKSLDNSYSGGAGASPTDSPSIAIIRIAGTSGDEDSLFHQPDTPQNLIFEEKEPDAIKGATLIKLVERLTNEKVSDTSFGADFLLTFRSFTNSRECLNLLIQRFRMPSPPGATYGQLQDWMKNVQRPIRIKIIGFIKSWIEKYPKDFTKDPDNGNKLHGFIAQDILSSSHQTPGEQLAKLLAKKMDDPNDKQNLALVFSEPPPKPMLPTFKKTSSSVQSAQLGFMDIPAEEIARQITLREFKMFEGIKPWEFFNQSWTKKDIQNTASPNIMKMIQQFNRVSQWVCTEILKAEGLKTRIATLARFIELADELMQYNNLNGTLEIISGLQAASIYRLKLTWEGLSQKQRDTFDHLKELVARSQNYAKLRAHLRQCNPPMIPYLGIYLTDLIFVEEGNKDYLEGGLINWTKRRRLATVIKEVQTYQLKPYNLESVHFLQIFLDQTEPLSEEACYEMSLQREAKENSSATSPSPPVSLHNSSSSLPNTSENPSSNSPTPSSPSVQPRSNASKALGFLMGKKNLNRADSSNHLSTAQTPLVSASSAAPVAEEQEVAVEEEEFELQHRHGYKFYDKDSDSNILLEREGSSRIDVVVGATLPKLIERLTYEKYPDSSYVVAFLMTYPTFTSPLELLQLLIMRFHIPPPTSTASDLVERFQQKKERPIMLRVLNVCKMWVDRHFEDFKNDPELLSKFISFVENSMVKSILLSKAGTALRASITSKMENGAKKRAPSKTPGDPPKPLLPGNFENLLDLPALELARQLAIRNWNLLEEIVSREFVLYTRNQGFDLATSHDSKESAENMTKAPHVSALVSSFMNIRDWVITEIVKVGNKDERAKVLDHFITTIQHSLSLNDYFSSHAMVSALESDPILGLKSTWMSTPVSTTNSFGSFRSLFSLKDNYKSLRSKLSSIEPPCVSPIAVYLHDLAHIRETVSDNLEPSMFIHFSKRQRMASVVNLISNLGIQRYKLTEVETAQNMFSSLSVMDYTEAKKISAENSRRDGDAQLDDSWDELFGKASANSKVQRASTITALVNPAFVRDLRAESTDSNSSQNSRGSSGSVSKADHAVFGMRGSSGDLHNVAQEKSNLKTRSTDNVNSSSGFVTASPSNLNRREAERRLHTARTLSIEAASVKTLAVHLFLDDPNFRAEFVRETQTKQKFESDEALKNHFGGGEVSGLFYNDRDGTVFGWQEEISAKVFKKSPNTFIAPILSPTLQQIGKADLSIYLRAHKFLTEMFGQPTKLAILGVSIDESTLAILTKMGAVFVPVVTSSKTN